MALHGNQQGGKSPQAVRLLSSRRRPRHWPESADSAHQPPPRPRPIFGRAATAASLRLRAIPSRAPARLFGLRPSNHGSEAGDFGRAGAESRPRSPAPGAPAKGRRCHL